MSLTLSVTYFPALELWEVGTFGAVDLPEDLMQYHPTPEMAVAHARAHPRAGVVYRYGEHGINSGPPLFPKEDV